MSVLRFIQLSAIWMFFASTHAAANTPEQRIIAVQQAKIEVLQKQLSQFKSRVAGGTLALNTLQCDGKLYNCSVRTCVDLCIKKGGRVAHRHELADMALKGQNHCAHTISYDATNDRFDMSYPMYSFQGGGCWNASQVPVMPLMPISADKYNTLVGANCACMLPMSAD